MICQILSITGIVAIIVVLSIFFAKLIDAPDENYNGGHCSKCGCNLNVMNAARLDICFDCARKELN